MDDRHTRIQDVIRCQLCETPGPPMYCDICHIHLCVVCVGKHLLDESKEHKVVPFKKRGLIPKCLKHSTQLCDLYCKKCDIPICLECVSSREHLGHEQVGILKILENKKEPLQRDLQELENTIYPKYREIASCIPIQRDDMNEKFHVLTTALDKHGEDLHIEINNAIDKFKSYVNEMESKQVAILNKHEDEIKITISEITRIIADLKKLLKSNNIGLVSAYKSRNAELKISPPTLGVSIPKFIRSKINKEHIYQQIGSLATFSMKTEDYENLIVSPGANRLFIDVPRIITEINTKYGESKSLYNLSCLNDDQVWTCGRDNRVRLYNLHGKLVKSIQTKSGNSPCDIAVTQSGELVYTDTFDSTVNIVKNKKIQPVIRLRGWVPTFMCSTSNGNLLVVMVSVFMKRAKVVRYSGFTEKQSIGFNDKGQPLYSSGTHTKYISENMNLDVCVADSYNNIRAVVVVNQYGKLRFIYTSPLERMKPFKPVGITTDSQSRILTTDINNNLIHILDQDGQFLRYIDNCHLQRPVGLCVDTRDNLIVAEQYTGKMKKILYYI